MYSISQIISGLTRPRRVATELNCIYHRTRASNREYYSAGTDIFEEDWDNMIILDACRFDYFAKQQDFPGTLEKRRSRGSITSEFLRGNFSDRQLYDVVYVSSNPWYLKLRDDLNSDVHSFIDLREEFSNREFTVAPDKVTERSKKIAEEYPHKRLIIHYLQPHQPYIGPTGQKYFETTKGLSWTMKESDKATDDRLQQAYKENLELVLDAVSELLPSLEGKTIITADHGELLGDRSSPIPIRSYGHYPNLWVKELLEVPWLEYTNNGRREIISEKSGDNISVSDEEVDARLENLGYKL